MLKRAKKKHCEVWFRVFLFFCSVLAKRFDLSLKNKVKEMYKKKKEKENRKKDFNRTRYIQLTVYISLEFSLNTLTQHSLPPKKSFIAEFK